MATVTRVGGTAHMTVGVQHEVGCHCYLLTVQNAANTAQDLRAEDDAVEEAAEYIMKELSPLMYMVTNSAAGTIHVVMDNNSSAADMQIRIRRLGTTVGPNNIDVTGSDVTAGTSVVIS